ncbi:MAG: MurR/RpiR family transcriptional regulator [Aristaeellaceae bacterium]
MDNAQELIQRLNHSGKKLSKSHRRIAECIVTHYDKVVFMTASKLGEYVGVSESTVVRFAAALGYSGYPQLQKALQELLRHRLTASQRFELTNDMDHVQVLNKVLKADIQNIRSTLDEIDISSFERAIDMILQARQIYVMGLRSSAPIAEFFVHYLKFIFSNVRVVTSGVSDVFEQLSRIGEGDLLIGISFPRYASRSIEAMDFARKQGASLIAITDGPLSPLHSTADICLMAKSDMSSFVDSFAAPLSLINALIVALGQRRRTEVSEYFNKMEKIWAEYDVYLAKNAELTGEKK